MPISRAALTAFYALFAASGFAALIYESIWSHYLKLFLGHAAYAQALVLALFMGGMAVGAWWCGARSPTWRNLLLGYAAAEAAIGVCGLVFHRVFVAATDFAHESVIPQLGSPLAVDAFKWALGALLILPQSVLLGMTFPLMAGGLLRRMQGREGETVAGLYFTNSLGAAAGVLASGFVLIAWVGLPGTLLTAALINLLLAALVYLYARHPSAAPVQPDAAGRASLDGYAAWMLVASFVTGAASFMYEIGWIRMLTMVLGAATHAFELMLSAFILGLAFGGLWIKRRVDAFPVPERALGVIQVAMGVLALATLVVYGRTFDAMKILLGSLAATEAGYAAFNLGSHAIAIAVMLPATFCAGMTLPLLTLALMRRGGERAVGAVYAANTVGAIAGVFVAIHVGLPLLGVKGLIVLGAALDIGLGLALLWRYPAGAPLRRFAAAGALFALAGCLAFVELDPLRMASGVFRVGDWARPESAAVRFHRDGKTATVHVLELEDRLSIRTNGKSDGSIGLPAGAVPQGDEQIMLLSGALPLVLRPETRSAAVIGIGTGLSSHALLGSTALRELETIEIEPAMVEAAQLFRPRNERVFADPRSRVRIEDAKTFFASQRRRFDLVVSMPSNPWVSGVASLFSEQFYAHVKRHLEPGGLFVQWLQLYELSPALAASVMKALGRQFSDYDIYAADDFNLLIVARDRGPVPPASAAAFAFPALAGDLARLGIRAPSDLAAFYVGSRAALGPYFESFDLPPNSDYFPVLDQGAARARFLRANAAEIAGLATLHLPAVELLGSARRVAPLAAPHARLAKSGDVHGAYRALAWIVRGDARSRDEGLAAVPGGLRSDFELLRVAAADCRPLGGALPFHSAVRAARYIVPNVSPGEAAPLWQALRKGGCRPDAREAAWLELFGAVDARDAAAMAAASSRLLQAGETRHPDYLLGAALLGHLGAGRTDEARALWERYAAQAWEGETSALPALLRGHLLRRARP